MNILVTGAGGFIGRRLFETLRDEHDVVGFTERFDITEIDDVRRSFKMCKPDVVFHLAGMTRAVQCRNYPWDSYAVNCHGTANVILGCREFDSKLIFVSSWLAEYPQMSTYGFHKYLAERLCNTHIDRIVRLGNVYGEYPRCHSVLTKFIKMMKDGVPIQFCNNYDTKRDFTHVDDVVDGLIGVMKSDVGGYIGTCVYTQLGELAKRISEILGLSYEIEELDKVLEGDVKTPPLDLKSSRKCEINIDNGIFRCKDVE